MTTDVLDREFEAIGADGMHALSRHVGRQFYDLALTITESTPPDAKRDQALRLLSEARDLYEQALLDRVQRLIRGH